MVFSTHVEVFQQPKIMVVAPDGCSPRTWRSSALKGFGWTEFGVLSTHVEVFPVPGCELHPRLCALHSRGGLPS